MSINYVVGNAVNPIGEGQKIIVHCCNDIGGWGAGFVLALSGKWPDVEQGYRQWHANDATPTKDGKEMVLPLGQVQFVPAEAGIEVANMIGQRGTGKKNGKAPIRYPAIKKCLAQVADRALALGASVHAPKFGAGLAGGDWGVIEELINEELCAKGVEVVVYEYSPQ